MKLIFCVDDKNGMMLFSRRQSQDKNLRSWLLDYVGDNKLFMSEYSAKQFENKEKIIIDNNYIINAQKDDFCFIEDKDYNVDLADEVILCCWNRRYQADKFFTVDLKEKGFKKKNSQNIVGCSHEKITIEIYRK